MSLSSAIMTHTGRFKQKLSHSFLMTFYQKWAEQEDVKGLNVVQCKHVALSQTPRIKFV